MDIFDVLTLIGGLCLFLFGMNLMGGALERSAGSKLEMMIGKLTSGKLAGLLTGLGVTAVIQSSSATTVMVVGFVNSRLMNLKQAIHVIMGANIGTTVTAWILSLNGISGSNTFLKLLKPSSFTPILALVGIIFFMFSKNNRKKDIGMVLLGFATLTVGMLPAIFAIALISIAVALILSHKMAASIVKPLSELDLERPTESSAYEELAPILTKINKQRRQITRQMQELRQKSKEFEQITASMSEGLVVLDQQGFVISINTAAKALYGVSDTVIGRDFLTVDRSTDMSRAIMKALDGSHSEFREERNGKEYQFVINHTESDGKIVGVLILCFDVTETAFAERNRREFTANVSHELKTPLQSIIGSAELLENGLVKPEDTGRFVGNIKNEAQRLLSLINDIIRLSQLDENSELAAEPVDLYDVANEVTQVLAASAAKKQLELRLNGEPCVISGVRRYLYEVIYNLCDNAIRYNQQGGKVTLDLQKADGCIILSVSDTGIGIPPEHQDRIFERFYRVDKSHSKETGGTGLGLSIVKHAVAYHGGTVRLDSKVGEGTTVSVTL